MSRSVKAKSSLPKKTVGLPFGSPNHPHKGGAPKGSANHRVHGHYQLKAALRKRGFNALSIRERAALKKWRAQIIEDLGGLQNVSEIKHDLINRYLQTSLLVQSLDDWFVEQFRKKGTNPYRPHPLINRRKHALYPIAEQRSRLVDSLLRLASAIGLQKQRQLPSLAEALTVEVDDE